MSISQEFIDRYQAEFDKNPNSKLFAPLAEAYRKMGRLEQAQNLCKRGVQIHANFASGRLAYAKILLDLNQLEAAYLELKKATELSPDNLLAFHLLGELCLKLKRPREALTSFKMLLFLHPEDERAQRAVKKWEFLGAEEFSDEAFEQNSADNDLKSEPNTIAHQQNAQIAKLKRLSPQKELDHALSLADALTIRNDLERALDILLEAKMSLGQVPEIERRLQMLKRRTQAYSEQNISKSQNETKPQMKKQKLESLLRRINEKNS